MLIGSVVMVQIGLLCTGSRECYSLLALATALYVLKVFTGIDPLVAMKGMCVEIQMAFRNNLFNWLWMPWLYAVHVGWEQQQYPSLQGVGVELHHVRLRLPLAVLYVSSLYPSDSTPCFYVGKGSRTAISHHTAGSDHSLWGCLFWVLGRPESFKWGVLRSARWEKGGYRRWQWVRVSPQIFIRSLTVCQVKFVYVQCSRAIRCDEYGGGAMLSWWFVPPLVAGRAPLCAFYSASMSPRRATST